MPLVVTLGERLVDWLSPRRRREERLRERGEPAQAEVVSAERTNTYKTAGPGGPPRARIWKLELRVRPASGREYDATIKEWFRLQTGPVIGSTFGVLYDPDKPSDLMVDERGGASIPTTQVEDPSLQAGITIDLRGNRPG